MATQEKTITDLQLEDFLVDFKDECDAKYQALEAFTIQTLREQNSKIDSLEEKLNDMDSLDQRLDSVREDLEKLKNKPDNSLRFSWQKRQSLKSTDQPSILDQCEIEPNSSTPQNSPVKKKTKLVFGSKFLAQRSPPPKYLEDIKEEDLKNKVSKYYEKKVSTAEKLTPAQLAFLIYYFERVKHGEYSARSDVICQLYAKGVEHGLWYEGWTPHNIKGSFTDYLKEKVRNLNKKRLQEVASNELIHKLME